MVNEHKIEAGTEENKLSESILRRERIIMKKEVMILTGAGQIGMAIFIPWPILLAIAI